MLKKHSTRRHPWIAEADRLFALENRDEPGTVNIVVYRGTIYGVYYRYEDARTFAHKKFGENALLALDVTILRQKVE